MSEQNRAPWAAGRPAAVVLAALALTWLAGTLVSAHTAIAGEVGVVALTAAAYALPGVAAAGLVGGAAVALLALRAWDPVGDRTPAARCAVALGAGAAVAAAAAGGFLAAAPGDPHRGLAAATLAAAATVGGGLVWPRRLARVCAAGVAAALAAFAAGLTLTLAKSPVQKVLGGGGDAAAQVAVEGRFAVLSAVATGLVAGWVAYRWLGRRATGWPGYLLAGATPGLVLLLGEAIARIGGAELVALTRDISDADATLQGWLDGSRLNNALVVLFLAAITALVLAGRALPPRPAPA
ncbi:MAG TPA: hypothetical protein VFY17_04210 [Pilimelia sp.]|nr:hypothetical protein [Pilimelia sp.]